MDGLRQTAIAVIAAALICGIVTPVLHGSTASELLRLLCGVFVAVSLLSHVKKIDFEILENPVKEDMLLARQQADMGQSMARSELEDIIKGNCEAYILDKAAQLDAQICVEVALSEAELPVPEAVAIRGKLSTDTKEQLSLMLTEDMGIAKEDQMWIG